MGLSDCEVTVRAASSPAYIRQLNARQVLDLMWTGEPTTASELMQATGLTRATVLALCRTLTAQGWLRVLENSRQAGAYTKGRPALRYAFRQDAFHVVGVDAGQHRISATAADLHAHELGYAERRVQSEGLGDHAGVGEYRRALIAETVDAAMREAQLDASRVRVVAIGVPAPIDVKGYSPVGFNDFWAQMNPHLRSFGHDRGWESVVENDANLAALAELHRNPDNHHASFAALLSGERMGAGIVIGGQLLRQPRGGAGELGILDLVKDVESPEGIARWARRLAQEAIAQGRAQSSELRHLGEHAVEAEHVFAAAAAGDPLGLQIREELSDRLARICAVLAGILDLDRIVISGAVAAGLAEVTESARIKLDQYLHAPWLDIDIAADGAHSVRLGAVRRAVDWIHENALQIQPGEFRQ